MLSSLSAGKFINIQIVFSTGLLILPWSRVFDSSLIQAWIYVSGHRTISIFRSWARDDTRFVVPSLRDCTILVPGNGVAVCCNHLIALRKITCSILKLGLWFTSFETVVCLVHFYLPQWFDTELDGSSSGKGSGFLETYYVSVNRTRERALFRSSRAR